MSDYAAIEKEARIFTEECVTNNRIDPTLFAQYDIKRGLRDKNGKACCGHHEHFSHRRL